MKVSVRSFFGTEIMFRHACIMLATPNNIPQLSNTYSAPRSLRHFWMVAMTTTSLRSIAWRCKSVRMGARGSWDSTLLITLLRRPFCRDRSFSQVDFRILSIRSGKKRNQVIEDIHFKADLKSGKKVTWINSQTVIVNCLLQVRVSLRSTVFHECCPLVANAALLWPTSSRIRIVHFSLILFEKFIF